MKRISRIIYFLMLTALLSTVLTGCMQKTNTTNESNESNEASDVQISGDWPAMIMIDGKLYYQALAIIESVSDSAIIGYTSSYTDNEPSKDGETNFSRKINLPYARVDEGVAVKYDGQWHLFVQKNNDKENENGDSLMTQTGAKQYVWEKQGFGGDFVITLNDNGTYQYYVGFLSSYIGMGTWTNENGIITLTENKEFCGYDNVFKFNITDEGLIFIAEGSSKFMYVEVEDGDKFLFRNSINWDEKKYTPDYDSTSTLHADVFLKKLKKDGYHRGDEIDKNYNTDNIKGIFNITPQAILEENPDLELFYIKEGYHCFMMYKGEIYRYETFGGYHHQLVLWDYDGNGVKDLVSYCSYGSGVSYLSVGITDLTTMKAQPIITRGILWEPGFSFAFDGENVYINGEKLTYSNGEFHCGELLLDT